MEILRARTGNPFQINYTLVNRLQMTVLGLFLFKLLGPGRRAVSGFVDLTDKTEPSQSGNLS